VGNLQLRGVRVFHDERAGRERGENTIVIIESDGLRVAHLGDLGHELDDETLQEVGPVDVALIPVGGYFTIDAPTAGRVVAQLAPRIVIPMHYKTGSIDFPIAPVDGFLEGKSNVQRPGGSTLEVRADSLPEEQAIVVLEHAR
jgi:L-ascorbate metabolism protein UlaG (beta-lactamase superfamily)